MRCEFIFLSLVLSTGFLLTSVTADKGVIVVARSAGAPVAAAAKLKPTSSPLRTSTPRPPFEEVKPASAPIKTAAEIINAPPQLASSTAKQEIKAENVTEPLPLQTPPTEAANLTPMAAMTKQAMPLEVTGFITRDGNIYEVTDKNGIGRIESRQNIDTDNASHICNYGSVVIYSDVPCDEVTNVHIGEVQTHVINTAQREQQQTTEASQQSATIADANNGSSNNNNNNSNHVEDSIDKLQPNATTNGIDNEDFNDFDDRPQTPKKRKRGNKKPNNQRNGTGNGTRRQRPNALRQGGSNRHRQTQRRQPAQKQKQQKQQQRRRLQNKNKQQRRRLQQQQQQQQKRRRNQNGNRKNAQRRQSQRVHGGGNYNRRRYNNYDFDYEERSL